MIRPCIILISIIFSTSLFSQELQQNIRGMIIDRSSEEVIPFASVILEGTDLEQATISDQDGNFVFQDIPLGRYDLIISYLGYETVRLTEILLTSSKEVVLNIALSENHQLLDEVIIKPKLAKERPLNTMSSVSARRLSVEEASRYAGGFDDPARLAASFPGVASSVGNNAIVIRGNSPKYLQWKVEGVEVPNPNHFADLGAFGGGGLTALSSNLLSDSDFFTGAFPAEYNNALSGIFDIKMREGNQRTYEHSLEAGLIGMDVTSEGPLSKSNHSSYLINYRYSTLGLMAPILPEDAQGTNYQDLAFKLKVPTKNVGTFRLWSIGLIDNSNTRPEREKENQNYYQDIENQDVRQYMGAIGLNHKILLRNSSYINTTLALSTSGIDLKTDRLNSISELQPENEINNSQNNLTFKSVLHKKFSANHAHQSGLTVRGMWYNLSLEEREEESASLKSLVYNQGRSSLISIFSSSRFTYHRHQLNIGLNFQLFTLNRHTTMEPRFGWNYTFNPQHKISLGYGLHSRLEPLHIYFIKSSDLLQDQGNKDLDFTQAHHFVFGYDCSITDNLHLKIEPYFQYLFNVPIVANSTNSIINLQNDWFVNGLFSNQGKGKNYGIDLTLERYLYAGYYYLVSASIFDSKYTTDSEKWYHTRFNRNYLFNILFGKEFRIGSGKQNRLGINIKMSVQGGERYSPVDEVASLLDEEVVYDETRPFTNQDRTAIFGHVTINYEWYKKGLTHRLSLKLINATAFKEFQGHRFNITSDQVEEFREALIVPNLSYKIAF